MQKESSPGDKVSPSLPAARPGNSRRAFLSANALKCIAVAAMFIDHAATAFLPEYYSALSILLHFIGRITGPVMFYFVVEGYHHTRDKNRYTLRMGLFALVSWLPFVWFRSGQLWPGGMAMLQLNVIYTLFLGLLALRALHELPHFVLQAGAVVALVLLATLGDWGATAVVVILLFDLFRGRFRDQAIAYSAVVVARMLPGIVGWVERLLAGDTLGASLPELEPVLVTAGMFLPLMLLAFYNGRLGRGGKAMKWLFYIVYPAHLALLALLRYLLA